jgi:hypothetical protein
MTTVGVAAPTKRGVRLTLVGMPDFRNFAFSQQGWTGLVCGLGDGYAVLSPDTEEGLAELMHLHMVTAHPGQAYMDSRGVIHRSET